LIDDIGMCAVPAGQAAFWWLGQHGFALKLGPAVCYVDAFLSPRDGRQVAPLLRPEEVTNADLVLGSHDHADHIDRAAWPGIAAASPQAKFVVPALLREKIVCELGLADDRVLGVDQDLAIEACGVAVTAVPAAHEFLDRDPRTGLHPCVGFVLVGGGFCIYHAGDTCLYEGMQALLRRWRFDLALLPINGRDARRLAAGCIGNMTYQEAADLAGAIRPGLTVPTHFEMFAGNSEDPQLFLDYMRVKYPDLATHLPRHGERADVCGRQSSRQTPSAVRQKL
jgi:L-ascorbate metabolism protein UlaG (beta-lactamase superfamily)